MDSPSRPSVDGRTLVTVALALAVAFHGFAGAATADGSVTVGLAEAADSSGDAVTEAVTYTFTADTNRSVTANARETADAGSVVFEFARWEDRTTGQDGTGRSWTVRAGHEYRVTFEVTVRADAAADRYAAQVFDSGPFGQVEVDVTRPRFGSIGRQDVDLVFKSEQEGSATKDVAIPNRGDGVMMPEEVTFGGVPAGFSVDYSGLPGTVQPGSSGSFELEVSADSSVDEGTHRFDVTVTDNLGNAETFPVSVTVTKPAVASAGGDDSEVDVGDVLVGTEKTTSFTVTEEAGFRGISGVDARRISSGQYGSISFDGLNYVDTAPGGSDTADVTISAPEDASQHAELDWTVRLRPQSDDGVGERVTFTGRVIYPPRFGSLSMSNTSMVFDEPRTEVSAHTKTVAVEIPNTGDQQMNVQDVTARTDSGSVTASVVDAPDTVGGTSSKTARVRIRADADAGEGDYSMTVTVDAEDAGQESVTEDVSITHGVELSVGKTAMEYGDVIVTKNLTRSTDVAETLEYEQVSDLSVTKVSGPDEWLTVVERPAGTLTPGESAPFVVALRFDTSAELYREYEWRFEVSGEGVATRTVTVTGTPKPYSFDRIRDPLNEYTGSGDWRSETAGGMVETLDALESKLRGGDGVSKSDLSTSIAAGRATLLFIESVENASQTMDAEGNGAAQDEVVRAAASYNLLDSYVSKLDGSQLRSSAGESRAAADETVDELVADQTDYYRSRLDSGDVTEIERAQIKRQLAQLASLQGEEQRAERLRTESAAAFDAYSRTVEEGNRKRQRARQLREEMRGSMLTVVAGQPLVLNPANWDAFDRKSAAVLSSYDAAATSFAEAGATEEAGNVRTERQQAAGKFRLARYSLYGATGVYGLGFVGLLVYLGRNTYAYIRDAKAAVTGDFLVAS